MLTASSPIQFPNTSSPPGAKRERPNQTEASKPKPKVKSGFVLDDDSSDDDQVDNGPPLKKLLTSCNIFPLQRSQQHVTHDEHSRAINEPAQGNTLPVSEPASQQNHGPFDSQHELPSLEALPNFEPVAYKPGRNYTLRNCDGKSSAVRQRKVTTATSYESMVAARTKTKEGRAKRGYYGIDINELMDAASKDMSARRGSHQSDAKKDAPRPSVEDPETTGNKRPKKTLLWTEKYRARTFMDLCGDDGTNRMVLRWLKRWDPLVFPGAAAKKPSSMRRPGGAKSLQQGAEEEKPHRKILMLTGPPGLGKTTLAHVCARQAGYEVMEINASDERSSNVVKNRIRTSLGTESVKNVENKKVGQAGRQQAKVARPSCVVVDEVDGVVSGAGGSGEGGFVKALVDLVLLDQKNSSGTASSGFASEGRRRKRGDDFRLMRPLILICNDVYHPSLKPLRQANMAEIIHVGKPTIDAVVGRLKTVFDKEGIPCEKDAARKICEAAWGMTSGIDVKRGAQSGAEGDLRGVMVVGEWVAGRYRTQATQQQDDGARLTRQWLEKHVAHDLANGAGGARGLGRGSARDIVSRVFQEGGGFPKQALDASQSKASAAANKKFGHEQPRAQLGFSEHSKKHAMDRLEQMIHTSGEVDRVMTDVMLEYPNREFNDDLYLSKPNQAYDWVAFHDACSSRLFSSQEWELAPYVGQPVLACHDLFASSRRHVPAAGYDRKWAGTEVTEEPQMPFSGARADFEAFEAEKHNRAGLQAIHAQLSPTLMRSFRSPEDIASEFLPYLARVLSPDVKPVVVGGGGDQKGVASVRKDTEKVRVTRAAEVLADVGVALQRGRIETEGRGPQWVYRMDPDLDALTVFETAGDILTSQAPTRYAVRQVIDQELQASLARRENAARQSRFRSGGDPSAGDETLVTPEDKENERKKKKQEEKEALLKSSAVKRDFFGRVIETRPLQEVDGNANCEKKGRQEKERKKREERKVWVTYHEGMNNAVRKPISLAELVSGL